MVTETLRPRAAGFHSGYDQGLVRSRILQELRASLDRPFTILVAPAGSGKSTALGHFVAALELDTAWYRPLAQATDPARLLSDLQAVMVPAGQRGEPWLDVNDALGTLHAQARRPTVLVIDDLHAIVESRAEAMLEEIIRNLPDWLRIVAASRRSPDFNLSDLLVTGLAVQVPEDALRWRPWEVELLFRDVYHSPLRPEHAARLSQRTEGWSAGLHLFHLASAGLGENGRQGLIAELRTTPALVRDYLTRNVLQGLSGDVADFMLDTCVLGRLDARLCDRLRRRDDSLAFLDTLRARRLFVIQREDGRGMRYHEVLRSYLEASLLQRDGPVEVRRRQLRAGLLLEEVGDLPEALHGYVRAEAWDHAERVVDAQGPGWLSHSGRSLLDRLPSAFVQADPWLQVARARILVGEGQLHQAVLTYQLAEAAFGREVPGNLVRRELRTVRSWAAPRAQPLRAQPDATELLQAALRNDPQQHGRRAASGATATELLVAAGAMLLAGAVDEGRQFAARAATAEGADLLHLASARALGAIAGILAGDHDEGIELAEAADSFERLGLPWAAHLVRTFACCVEPHDSAEVARNWQGIDATEDPWGAPLMQLLGGMASLATGGQEWPWLDEAADALDDLHAPVAATWARAWSAVAKVRSGDQEAEMVAKQARARAHALQVPGAEAIAETALGALGGPRAADSRAHGEAVAAQVGLALPELGDPPAARVIEVLRPHAWVRCFGGLEYARQGIPVDLDGLRPQARMVLAMVAVGGPQPVHRERLAEVLWPQVDPTTQQRRLPVLVSTLRRHLEPQARAGDWQVLVRVGDAFSLRLPRDGWFDVAAFDAAVAAARSAHRHDTTRRLRFLQVAFDSYRGELLPEFGAATWILEAREQYRMEFVDVAQALASAHLQQGQSGATIDVVRAGLRADRYRSELWQLLSHAHRQRGDVAAAVRADHEHRAALTELGIAPSSALTGTVRTGAS